MRTLSPHPNNWVEGNSFPGKVYKAAVNKIAGDHNRVEEELAVERVAEDHNMVRVVICKAAIHKVAPLEAEFARSFVVELGDCNIPAPGTIVAD